MEDAGHTQRLNLDFLVTNVGPDTLELRAVELSVYDAAGRLALRQSVDDNGFAPGIRTIPERTLAPGDARLVFSPFHSFEPDLDLARLDFAFRFTTPGNETIRTRAEVQPVRYTPAAELELPLSGRVLVWDGHDALSHHRRFDFTHPVAASLGFRTNFMRYAHDFVAVDTAGATHAGDGSHNADYFGFGAPVLAPAAGTVVAVLDGELDNEGDEDHFDPGALVERPMLLFGNHVVIDHGGGAFSLLGHVRNGSVAVAVGARVERGQMVAEVGSSGSSYFPHLHFEMRTGAGVAAEGLPAYFVGFERVLGARSVHVARGPVDSGQIVSGSPTR